MCHRYWVDQTGTASFVVTLVQDRPFHLLFLVAFQAMNPAVCLTLLNSFNDRDGSGSVSVEEATQILYLRFGNGLLDKVSFRKI